MLSSNIEFVKYINFWQYSQAGDMVLGVYFKSWNLIDS